MSFRLGEQVSLDIRAESGCCLLSHLFFIYHHQEPYLRSSRSTSLRQIKSDGFPGFLSHLSNIFTLPGIHVQLTCLLNHSAGNHSGKHPPASQSLPHPPVVFSPAHSKAISISLFGTFSHLDSCTDQPLHIQLHLPLGPLCYPGFPWFSQRFPGWFSAPYLISLKNKSYFFL